MIIQKKHKWVLIILIISVTITLFLIGINNLHIDTDILNSLPKDDPVLSDASYIFKNHPIQEKIIIDVSLKKKNTELLAETATEIEEVLRKSRLFNEVGTKKIQKMFPELLLLIINNLPVLFTEKELNEEIKPMLKPDRIRKTMEQNLFQLLNLEGIGQARFISTDPLGLKNIILRKLSQLNPSENATIYRGYPISYDEMHLLIVAKPKSSGTDTAFSRNFTKLINDLKETLNNKLTTAENQIILTPVGTYRAAMDNENIAKKDTRKAIIIATIGIALLLLFSFPRPLIGLMSLSPAIFGVMMSIFIFSIFNDSISILAVGFGGAIISITVDHGIAYLLFLDRPYETTGRGAAREIWSVGLLATLTTVGAFSFLFISGFQILAQIGQFAATGILFSFIFVHTIFPLIFPTMPSAKKKKTLPLQNLVNRFALSGKKYKALGALILVSVMIFFAKPKFYLDLESMNTLSKDTIAAEELIKTVWGDVLNKIYLMIEADSIDELQKKSDILLEKLSKDAETEKILSFFSLSMIFPGKDRARENFNAWKKFWNNHRISLFKQNFYPLSHELGFSSNAFAPFIKMLGRKKIPQIKISKDFWEILGIKRNSRTTGYQHFSSVTPGKEFNSNIFYSKYTSDGLVKIFDSNLFTKKLSQLLSSNFIRMFFIIGISVIVLLLLFFLDLKLTLISLIPIAFSFICTIGTLNIIGHPLDIPSLMLSIIILGIGIDYSLYFVRSFQRYSDEKHKLVGIIRLAVFLASGSTIIGFSALCFADHSLLKSAGITSLLGIGYSLIGTFTILPFMLNIVFTQKKLPDEKFIPGSRQHRKRTLKKYKHMEAYPRLFACFKIIFDPMFPGLMDFFHSPKTIIDIGCGYGVVSAWLLELFPEAKVYAIEPDRERARIAAKVFSSRGKVEVTGAPDIPKISEKADTILMIDMIHLINDNELLSTLEKLKSYLKSDSNIIVRVTIPSQKKIPWERIIENIRLKVLGVKPNFRDIATLKKIFTKKGFKIVLIEPTSPGREETWIVAVNK